jgi:ATP-dependent DNA ligase
MRPESAPEHGSKSSSIWSKNSLSADTPNPKGLGNISARCWLASTIGKKLKFGGRVGTGFSEKLLSTLYSALNKIRIEQCPFFNLPAAGRSRWDQGLTAAEMKRCHWVKPAIVCQVKFTEWTRDDRLRQPVFLGLREDKNANEVVREKAS